MRALAVGLVLSACGANGASEPRASDPASASVVPAEAPVSPLTEPGPGAPLLDRPILDRLRLGMRPGIEGERPSSPAEVIALVSGAGGEASACATLSWVSDEDGVEDARCEGTIPLEDGLTARMGLTFRRFALPGEPSEPGLLTVELRPPQRRVAPDRAWHDAMQSMLTRWYGAPEATGANQVAMRSWRPRDRYVALVLPLIDPSRGTVEQLCTSVQPCPEPRVWIGGVAHPELIPHGFELAR